MVSAAGFEPATHALKGHRVKSRQRGFSSLYVVKAGKTVRSAVTATRIATRVISTNIVKSELKLRTNRNQARPIAYAAFSRAEEAGSSRSNDRNTVLPGIRQ